MCIRDSHRSRTGTGKSNLFRPIPLHPRHGSLNSNKQACIKQDLRRDNAEEFFIRLHKTGKPGLESSHLTGPAPYGADSRCCPWSCLRRGAPAKKGAVHGNKPIHNRLLQPLRRGRPSILKTRLRGIPHHHAVHPDVYKRQVIYSLKFYCHCFALRVLYFFNCLYYILTEV